jgi:hypothetical protein
LSAERANLGNARTAVATSTRKNIGNYIEEQKHNKVLILLKDGNDI